MPVSAKLPGFVSLFYIVQVMTFCISLFVGLSAFGQTAPAELYKKAAGHYKAAQYIQAVEHYEQLLEQGYKEAEVYYNLGNCYYKLNQTAKAVLNLERAAKLAPEDEDIQHNLKLANLKTIDKIQPVPQLSVITWWKRFISSHSSGGWATLALVLVWVSLISFAALFFLGMKKITSAIGVLCLIFSIFFLALGFRQNQKEHNPGEAVLMVPNTFVKSAPDENGNNLFMIHEGIKFEILDRVGSWHKIRLADGKVGWLEKETFQTI